MLNYSEIIVLINQQMKKVIDEDENLKGKIDIQVVNEVEYKRNRNKDPNKVYMVVRFAQGNETFAYTSIPFTMVSMGQMNSVELTQLLLMSYVTKYNLTRVEGMDLAQSYNTPNVVSNFNLVNDGMRSLFYIAGTFLVSTTQNFVESIECNGEKMDFVTVQYDFSASPEPAPFWGEGGYTRSFVKQGTIAFNLVSFLTNKQPLNDMLNIATKNGDMNNSFVFKIKFKNGITLNNVEFKLTGFSLSQNLVEVPAITITFTT